MNILTRAGGGGYAPVPRMLIMFACAAALSCGSPRPPVEAEVDTPGGAVVDSVTIDDSAAVPSSCADLHNTILKATPTRQAFGAAFGSPDSVIRSVEPNRHVPGALDSLFTVYYPGLAMSIRTPEAARDMATHVHIESNRYLAYPGIGIGTTPERLVDVLGDPSERDQEALTWDCSEHVEQPVTFRITGGRVHAIDITYYVD